MRSVALRMTVLAANIVAASSHPSAQTPSPSGRFDVASVKPNRSGALSIGFDVPGARRFTVNNAPLRDIIRFAHDVDEAQLVGGPEWIRSERFDIVATAERDIPAWTPDGPPAVLLAMVRSLLAERFHLETHTDTRDLPVYALVLARADRKLGPRASVSTVDCAAASASRGDARPALNAGEAPACGMRIGPGQMLLGSVPMSRFATVLAPFARRLVIDRTGLTGNYNLQLSWTPQGPRFGGPPPEGAPPLPPADPDGASLFASIQEQLGLKLEPTRAPLEVVVIDRVERPSPD
jgi:uncharacterized protein (TIGR03435 family)